MLHVFVLLLQKANTKMRSRGLARGQITFRDFSPSSQEPDTKSTACCHSKPVLSLHFSNVSWRCVLKHESLVLTVWIAALYEDSPPGDQLAVQAEVMRLMAAPQHVAGQPAPLPRLPS